MSLIRQLLERDEGRRREPYRDHRGYWTIGVGHLIDRRRGGSLPPWIRASFPLEEVEVDELLAWDIRGAEQGLDERLGTWWRELDEVRRAVLLAMAHQMGAAGAAGFRKTMRAARHGDWAEAGAEMRRSDWYADAQTRARAERLSRAMETGDPSELAL